jgi:hypothetical protein
VLPLGTLSICTAGGTGPNRIHRCRPRASLSRLNSTCVHHGFKKVLYRDLPRPIIYCTASMVRLIHLDGIIVPCAIECLGHWSSPTRYLRQCIIQSHDSNLILFRTDDPKVPIHLLIYSVQTALTTATCIAEYLSWSDYSNNEKIELGKLYVPYLALGKSLHLSRWVHDADKDLKLFSWDSTCSFASTRPLISSHQWLRRRSGCRQH